MVNPAKHAAVWTLLRMPLIRFVGAVALTSLLSLVILFWYFGLWREDFSVPLQYGGWGDFLLESAWVKSIAEHGWYSYNSRLSAPGHQELHDFPLTDSLHFGVMRLLSLLSPSWGTVMNLYFILGFPLAAATAVVVLRALGLCYPAAIVSGILFAFLPYHFFRAQGHLQLASYYLVPPAVLIALWVWEGRTFYLGVGQPRRWRLTQEGVVSLVLGLLVGCAGVYYAFFAAYFILVASARKLWSERSVHRLRQAVIPISAIGAALILNLAPSILYWQKHGTNSEVAARGPWESEVYGLKLIQLLLPVPQHPVSWLAQIREQYNITSPLVNENAASSLGFLGAAGFCVLVGALFTGTPRGRDGEIIGALSRLNVAGVLMGTVGGLGTVFAWLISPKIRAYNRISVYLAFYSLAAVGLAVNALWRSFGCVRNGRAAAGLVVVGLLCIGILDQTTRAGWPRREQGIAEYRRDAAFFRDLEALLPKDGLVLQLPHIQFPEGPPVYSLGGYEHLRGYLHTQSLRFSYGAVRGRYHHAWLTDVLGGRRWDWTLEALAIGGFDAVLVDRRGYEDAGKQIERELSVWLGKPLIASPDGRYVCFGLRPLAEALRRRLTETDWLRARESVLYPPLVRWRGFYASEGTEPNVWRWCPWRGEIQLENPSTRPQVVAFEVELVAGAPEGCSLTIQGRDFSESHQLSSSMPVAFSRRLVLPLGRTTLRFSARGPRLVAPGDPRTLVFRVVNPRFRVVTSAPPVSDNPLLRPRIIVAN